MALPTVESCVAEEERLLGRRLPRLLRARLLLENGGEVRCDGEVWYLHSVLDARERGTAKRSASHIAAETDYCKGWPGFPAGAVAVAEDGTGDRLVLLAGSDDVVRWDHETGECHPVEEIDWLGEGRG
jgi:hypothetical protein